MESRPGSLVLDIGPGAGGATRAFREDGHEVTSIGLCPESYAPVAGIIDADYNSHNLGHERFDAIWCAHVLEHQPNVNNFIRKTNKELKPGGWLFVVVPPMKGSIVGGHLNLFNEGLLVYNLIIGGFDCSQALVTRRGYNIACFVQKPEHPLELPKLRYDKGDIEKLSRLFPQPVKQGFNGNKLQKW